jgi:hypothetical protein
MLITILFVIVFILSASLCYKFRNHDVSMVLLLLAVICAVGLIVCGAMCACTPYDSDLRTQDAMDKERMLLELRIDDDYWRKDARLTAELVHDVDEYNELVISMRKTYNSEWTSWFGRSWMADLTTVEFPEGGWK